jgi:hypothetical protein
MGWGAFVYWIASLLVSELLRPKVKVEDAKAAGLDEVKMPVASSTKQTPVVWGKVRLREPNVVWYGDYSAVPIKKKIGQNGLFGTGSAIWQTVAYRYAFGQQLDLCHGPVTLHKAWCEERVLWDAETDRDTIDILPGTETLNIQGNPRDMLVTGPKWFFKIDKVDLFGGPDLGGGIASLVRFYPGDGSTVQDPYLMQVLGDVPSSGSVASIVFHGSSRTMWPDYIDGKHDAVIGSGYIGTSPMPRPVSFEVSRYPNALNAAESKIGDDANAAEIIYECFTTDPNGPDGWGMGLSTTLIDRASFIAAAHRLYLEGFGISLIWDSGTLLDLVKNICATIDATCFRDPSTGLYTIKLMRDDYNIEDLPIFDVSNIIDVESLSQTSIDGTTNEVKVNYLDRSQDYKAIPAQAQDLANMRAQDEVVSASFTFDGITVAELADRVAFRELMALSTPLVKADLIVNRKGNSLKPGDCFVLNWAPRGISSMVMRVTKTAIGLPTANRIRISAVQDIFRLGSTAYMSGGGSQWQDPVPSPQPATIQSVVELPYAMNQNESQADFMAFARQPNAGCRSFEIWGKPHTASDYSYQDTCPAFAPSSTLASSISLSASSMTISGHSSLTALRSATESDMREQANLAIWETTGEIFSFSDVNLNADGTYTISGMWRGLFDTVPVSHTLGERVLFFSYGAVNPEGYLAQDAQIDIKLLPSGPRGVVAIAVATAITATMTGRNMKPLPPGNMLVNATRYPETVVGDAVVTWAHRNRLTQTQVVKQDDASDGSSAEGTYTAKVYVGGVLKRTVTGISGETWTYTAAMRIQDGTNGLLPVEIKVSQVNGALESAGNTTGAFLMTGFGMTFGNYFGGKP